MPNQHHTNQSSDYHILNENNNINTNSKEAASCFSSNIKAGAIAGAAVIGAPGACLGAALCVIPQCLCGDSESRIYTITGAAAVGAPLAAVGGIAGGAVGCTTGLICASYTMLFGKPNRVKKLEKAMTDKISSVIGLSRGPSEQRMK